MGAEYRRPTDAEETLVDAARLGCAIALIRSEPGNRSTASHLTDVWLLSGQFNNLCAKSKKPFRQQAYTDPLKFAILLRRIARA